MIAQLIVKIINDVWTLAKWLFFLVMDEKYGKPINHHLQQEQEQNETNASKLNDILKGI